MGIGKQIREIRCSRSITQRELAARAGITPAHLSNIENENASLSRRVLEQIAAALAISPADLLPSTNVSGQGQTVVDRRGRSAAEAFMIDKLARAIYQDVHHGHVLSEAGWRAMNQLSTSESDERTASVLDGLRDLGLVERNPRSHDFRLVPNANKQNPWVEKCIKIQKYRDQWRADQSLHSAAMQETRELLTSFWGAGERSRARLGLIVTGLTLALRESRLPLLPEELIQAKLVLTDLDSLRVRSAPRLAFDVLPIAMAEGTDRYNFLHRLGERWHTTPACSRSRHLLCTLFSNIQWHVPDRHYDVLLRELKRARLDLVAEWLLTAIYGSWVVWCYLERRKLLPFTDEAKADDWPTGIIQNIGELIDDVPTALPTCREELVRTLDRLRPVGESCESSLSDNFSYSQKAAMCHTRRVELLYFPWDDI